MSDATGPQRYTLDPLPPYSYVSGMFPHPTRDPAGHSYGAEAPIVEPPTNDSWPQCAPYLRGIDLFNHGYYWEAHECWESVWRGAEAGSITADFFKGLIKLAAAGVKAREGRVAGIARHARRAVELLSSVSQRFGRPDERYMGLRLAALIDQARAVETEPDAHLDRRSEGAVIVFPFQLLPRAAE